MHFQQPCLPAQPHCSSRAPAHTTGGRSTTSYIQERSDGALAFLLVTALPAGVYVATHLAVLFQWFHLWTLLLLGAGPLLFVTCLPGELRLLPGQVGVAVQWLARQGR